MKSLEGLGVALATPFNESGKIDFESLLKLLKHTAKKDGINYWVVMGSTGEAITLSEQEQEEVLNFIITHNLTNLPIVFGLGGSDTAALVHRLQTLDLSGVTAILISSPAYNKPSQEGIIAHFELLANNTPKPIILYNVPSRTCSNIEATTTLKLASHKNIIGIKEASGDLKQIKTILDKAPNDFLVTSGDDMQTPDIMSIGGSGVISVLANAFPQEFRQLVENAIGGNEDAIKANIQGLIKINGLMYVEGNPTGLKELLAQLGICSNKVRLPLVSATSHLQSKIKQYLINKKT